MDNLDDQISIFLGKIRDKVTPQRLEEDRRQVEDMDEDSDDEEQVVEVSPRTKARELANEAILKAEKFKASIAPEGRNFKPSKDIATQNQSKQAVLKVPPVDPSFSDDMDQEFLEMACHLDETTESKICQGHCVDVGKLIPKYNRTTKPEEGRVEIVNQDGVKFWVPKVEKESVKITDFKKWEQGFRVYAAVYSRANPHRSSEIWQYIHTINLASQSFLWENVAYYDFIFRQNMEKHPQRSWKKINNNLWSLAMRDPLPTRHNQTQNSNGGSNNRKPCCFRYNKGTCRRSNCKFEHRCSGCGSFSHILLACYKRKQQQKAEEQGNSVVESTKKDKNKNKNSHAPSIQQASS